MSSQSIGRQAARHYRHGQEARLLQRRNRGTADSATSHPHLGDAAVSGQLSAVRSQIRPL